MTGKYTPTERAEQKYPFWLPTGDYETDREDYSETDAKWQNAEAEMQRQAYIAGAESERAKRPDREQDTPVDDLTFHGSQKITIRHEGGNTVTGPAHVVLSTHLADGWSLESVGALASLPDKPETGEETGHRGWSTADQHATSAEAMSRFSDWKSNEPTLARYGAGCINGFILGAEWWKARTAPEAREVTDAEVESFIKASGTLAPRGRVRAGLEAAREVSRG